MDSVQKIARKLKMSWDYSPQFGYFWRQRVQIPYLHVTKEFLSLHSTLRTANSNHAFLLSCIIIIIQNNSNTNKIQFKYATVCGQFVISCQVLSTNLLCHPFTTYLTQKTSERFGRFANQWEQEYWVIIIIMDSHQSEYIDDVGNERILVGDNCEFLISLRFILYRLLCAC